MKSPLSCDVFEERHSAFEVSILLKQSNHNPVANLKESTAKAQ